jgi:hypothetical protein
LESGHLAASTDAGMEKEAEPMGVAFKVGRKIVKIIT